MSVNIRFITFRIRNSGLILLICILCIIPLYSIVSLVSTLSKSAEERILVPVIMYHSVLKDVSKSGEYIITPDDFEEDLKFLENEGYTSVFMSDLIKYVREGEPLPPKPVILTFDDGHYNNLTYVLPLLEKYSQRAVISIVGSYTDRYSKEPDENPNYAYLSWDNVRTLMDSGRIEIQNHSYNMHSLGARKGTHKKSGESSEQYRRAFLADVGKMQKLCREELDYTPEVFTYPFGSISLESLDYLDELGFSASLSCGEGINEIKEGDIEGLKLLKRLIRTHKRPVKVILGDK